MKLIKNVLIKLEDVNGEQGPVLNEKALHVRKCVCYPYSELNWSRKKKCGKIEMYV